MIAGMTRPLALFLLAAAIAASPRLGAAQEAPQGDDQAEVPGVTSYAPPRQDAPLATGEGQLTLAAQLTDTGSDLTRGLVWRVFATEPGPDGKLPLIAQGQGGTSTFPLQPGSYLVHAAFGRAGATKKITVGREAQRENLVLDAGGLKLDAVLAGNRRIPARKLEFSIYDSETDANGDRAAIIEGVPPNTVVRLNAGTYHVVSKYGQVNAVVRSDIRVEAGKLTEATVEHHAAELTIKLVREPGGEAIADTSWSIVADSGDPVRETVGAYASMVLSEGEYTIVAKNRDRIYQRDFTVVAGQNQEVEVLAVESAGSDALDAAD